MGSVRKVAVTAGLGAAIVTGAAAPALADDHAAPLPTVPKVAEENAGSIGPFPVSQVTDTLGADTITGGLGDTAQQTLPMETLPTGMLPSVPSGTPSLPGIPGMPGAADATGQSALPAVPDLGVPGLPGVTGAASSVTSALPGLPGLSGVLGAVG
ncbi:MAG TPA: hypothetical protein VLH10_21720 [Yinghuangia sp.]|nr:hypothetical protein [Yinghuangia sp.]